MGLTKNDIKLIGKHLEGSLTEEEEGVFKLKLSQSSTFSEEVALQKTMIASIKLEEREGLRNELKTEALKLRQRPSKKTASRKYYAAAVIALLIATTFLLLPSNDSVFDEYYTPFPESPVIRSESGTLGTYEQAMQLYSVRNYEKALKTFSAIEDPELYDEVTLYKGNCFLSLNEPKKAIDLFQLALRSSNSQINLQAKWFLALAYVDADNKIEATRLLKQIEVSDSPYKEKASLLLKKLRWVFY